MINIPVDSELRRAVEQPSPAQAAAGNYRKAHIKFKGLDIAIENPRGSTRSGVSADGHKWSNTMKSHYGYIKKTKGADNDHLDVFIGPDPESYMVYVVDQVNPANGKFDEHKIMLGFHTREEARKGYLANYTRNWQGLGKITSIPFHKLKRWVSSGDTIGPIATHKLATVVKKAELAKVVPMGIVGGSGVLKANLEAELADTLPARLAGMAKYSSCPEHGMLFDIPGPFWMKGMSYPLDLAFLTKSGSIEEIVHMPVENVPDWMKGRYASSSEKTAYALEMPPGWFKEHGIGAGDRLTVGEVKQAARPLNSPEFAYKAVEGKDPEPMRGRTSHPSRLWNGMPVDVELATSILDSLNAIPGVEGRASCAGHGPGRYAYFTFRLDPERDSDADKVAERLRKAGLYALADTGTEGRKRIVAAQRTWYGHPGWEHFWENLPGAIRGAVGEDGSDRTVRIVKAALAASARKPIDPTVERMWNALSAAETPRDLYPSPWIRTTAHKTPGGSTAYGPVQLTRTLSNDYQDRKLKSFTPGERMYLEDFDAQGIKALHNGNNKGKIPDYDPDFDYGGKGSLYKPRAQELYKRTTMRILEDIYNEKGGDPHAIARRWRGIKDHETLDRNSTWYKRFQRALAVQRPGTVPVPQPMRKPAPAIPVPKTPDL